MLNLVLNQIFVLLCFVSYSNCRLLHTDYLVRRNGYPLETHKVVTKDKYILTLHRIPYGIKSPPRKGKRAIVLMHGLFSCSFQFVSGTANDTLAFQLADNDFDIWLLNARGNRYSLGHKKYNPYKHVQFWWFGFDEIGARDLPDSIDYVLKVTSQVKVYYIGHSFGTTAYFAGQAIYPALGDRVVRAIMLAPTAYMNNSEALVFRLVGLPFTDWVQDILERYINLQLILKDGALPYLPFQGGFCNIKRSNLELCQIILTRTVGGNPRLFNQHQFREMIYGYPSGGSTRAVGQYAQLLRSPHFHRFSFTPALNIIKYGSPFAPLYNISNMKTRMTIVYSKGDRLTHYTNVETLLSQLPNIEEIIVVPRMDFGHMDYVLSSDINEMVNYPVLERMLQYREIDVF